MNPSAFISGKGTPSRIPAGQCGAPLTRTSLVLPSVKCRLYIMDETMITKDYGTMQLEQEIANRYKDFLSEYGAKDPNANYMNYMAVNWHMMRGGSMFIPQIVTSIILAFAVLILIIALVIISFSIKNFIQRNMKNTGILEASGYTVRELRGALVLLLLLP